MDETLNTQEETQGKSNTKWILLIAGGGCAVLSCVLLVVVLAVAMFFPITGRVFSEINEELDLSQPENEIPVTPQSFDDILIPDHSSYSLVDDNKMGNPNAPVKIVVYSDFQCIYCMRYWDETELKIIEEYVETGQVYYEYRSFGDFLGPQSAVAAEAAYCAGDQGYFWQYHDLLFINWTGEGDGDFSPKRLKRYAEAIGLDVDEFTACMNNGKFTDRVQQDAEKARADGIRATPSFLIDGKLLEGAQPFSVFRSEIDSAIGK